MAICVHCTTFVPSLWTVYSSATNVRLSLCSTCHQFADPYVEQPLLILALDLVLMDSKVYRHLLFNRGTPPTKLGQSRIGDLGVGISREENSIGVTSGGRKEAINQMLLFLTVVTVFSESYLRWATIWSRNDTHRTTAYTSVFARCTVASFIDSLAFQGSITLAIVLALSLWRAFIHNSNLNRGSRLESIPMLTKLIPLSIQLSSCPKLVLLLLVSIWRPELSTPNSTLSLPTLSPAFSLLTEAFEMTDREQVIQIVLGGLGAGFGLSVLLKPIPIGSPRDVSINFDRKSVAKVRIESSKKKKDGKETSSLNSRKDPKLAMRAWLDSALIMFLVFWGYTSKEFVSRFVIGSEISGYE